MRVTVFPVRPGVPGAIVAAVLGWAIFSPAALPGAANGSRSAPGPDMRAEYAPGELIVKFSGEAAQRLRNARVSGEPLHEVSLSAELDALSARYAITQVAPVFHGYEIRDESGTVLIKFSGDPESDARPHGCGYI